VSHKTYYLQKARNYATLLPSGQNGQKTV